MVTPHNPHPPPYCALIRKTNIEVEETSVLSTIIPFKGVFLATRLFDPKKYDVSSLIEL